MPLFGRGAVQAPNVDVPVGVHCLPLLERGNGHITGFGEEDSEYLF